MEHLQTQDKKQRRIVYSKGGNEVLRLAYPTVTGDTPAATHTATLVKALVDFGEKEAAKIAAAALLTALQSGRLFDFTRHTYDVSLKIARLPTHTEITLAVVFHNGNSPVFEKKKLAEDNKKLIEEREKAILEELDRIEAAEEAAKKAS